MLLGNRGESLSVEKQLSFLQRSLQLVWNMPVAASQRYQLSVHISASLPAPQRTEAIRDGLRWLAQRPHWQVEGGRCADLSTGPACSTEEELGTQRASSTVFFKAVY